MLYLTPVPNAVRADTIPLVDRGAPAPASRTMGPRTEARTSQIDRNECRCVWQCSVARHPLAGIWPDLTIGLQTALPSRRAAKRPLGASTDGRSHWDAVFDAQRLQRRRNALVEGNADSARTCLGVHVEYVGLVDEIDRKPGADSR